ncbi:MAG: glycosyltransferase [Anaerolineales bacterium]|nr:glycosyltransferase [Anaerolineales bacterium]
MALVLDALVNTGGAERVLTHMQAAFPSAPIYTAAYLPEQTYAEFKTAHVLPLPGWRLARSERAAKRLLPVWLVGFARLDLSRFDIILTSSTWGAKFVRPPRSAIHVCYCYAPFRWLWNPRSYSADSLPFGGLGQRALDLLRAPLRRADYQVTRAIPRLATTCANMARAIEACYGRSARIIYAPIRVDDYGLASEPDDYYLVVSRLISHKRLDLAVTACRELGRRLIVVGEGPERAALAAQAGVDTRFVGRLPDAEVRHLYAHCRAVIYPSLEDYGLVPLEAQAAGRPVIAYGRGGALETIQEGVTGVFFHDQTAEALIAAIQDFETVRFDSHVIRQAALRFDVGPFINHLREYVLAE